MELLLGFLKNPKYKLFPIIKFIEQNIVPLKEQGVEWGFDIPYLLTGHLNQHPRAAIAAMKEGRKDYSGFYKEIIDKEMCIRDRNCSKSFCKGENKVSTSS